MIVSDVFRDQLIAAIPSLRAFAVSLSGNATRADDLVQETLVKAWANHSSFEPGTNLRAWLYTILRNEFYSQMRKKAREIEDSDGALAARLAVHPGQQGHMDMVDFRKALSLLPDDQREALVLVGATGLSYEEAAEVCGCAVGTIKSRVSRARSRLAEVMQLDSAEDFGPDQATGTILAQVGGSRT